MTQNKLVGFCYAFIVGIALAMVLDWCIKAALDIYRFRNGKWKNKKVI